MDNDFYPLVLSDINLKKEKRDLAYFFRKFQFLILQKLRKSGVYEELIDMETWDAPGEDYAPKWLYKRIIMSLILKKRKILEPTSKRGSFIWAAIHNNKSIQL